MRVFELMAILADMPANATVVFERLATKDEMKKWPNDPTLIHIEFTVRQARLEDPKYDNATSRVILDGWSE